MTNCDEKCQLSLDFIPSFCLNGLLLVYIPVLIYKTIVLNRIFNFVLAALIVLVASIASALVLDVLGYKIDLLYLELYAGGQYTPD